jgi:hypothetical protein
LLSARRARASEELPLVLVMVTFTVEGRGPLFGFPLSDQGRSSL